MIGEGSFTFKFTFLVQVHVVSEKHLLVTSNYKQHLTRQAGGPYSLRSVLDPVLAFNVARVSFYLSFTILQNLSFKSEKEKKNINLRLARAGKG